MASHRYIGYVGRLAVAVGVGAAAIAVAPGTAYAETGTSADSTTSEARGSQDTAPDAKPGSGRDEKAAGSSDSATSDESDESDESEDESESDETDEPADDEAAESDEKDAEPTLATKLRKSAEQFEAEQVERLRAMLTPAKEEPAPERDSTRQVEPVAAVETTAAEASGEDVAESDAASTDEPVSAAAEPTPWRPDPFRPHDPDPDDVPAAVLALRDAILRAPIDPRIKPVIREGIELAYRISQVAPVANVPVPAYKIIPALAEAARGDKAGAQLIVNQLLLTTQPIALLYYGYDQIADLLNLEYEARELKEEFYRAAWDTVDPLALLHIRGQHGLGNSVLHR